MTRLQVRVFFLICAPAGSKLHFEYFLLHVRLFLHQFQMSIFKIIQIFSYGNISFFAHFFEVVSILFVFYIHIYYYLPNIRGIHVK